jgi:hypothetical protein
MNGSTVQRKTAVLRVPVVRSAAWQRASREREDWRRSGCRVGRGFERPWRTQRSTDEGGEYVGGTFEFPSVH